MSYWWVITNIFYFAYLKAYRIFIFHPILIWFFLLLNEMCYMLSEVCWQFLQSFTEQHPLFFFLLYWVTIEHQILYKNECNNLSLNLDFIEHWTQTYIWIIKWVIQTQVSLWLLIRIPSYNYLYQFIWLMLIIMYIDYILIILYV